jgi:hypothetical protein
VALGEREVDEEVGLGRDEQRRDRREAGLTAVDRPPQLGPRGGLVGLLEDRADDGRDHAPGRAGDEVLGVAGEVDAAALPGATKELLANGLDEAGVVVADDQADAAETALDETPDEGRPGAALVVARGELESQDPPLAGGGDAGRDEGRDRDDPARLATSADARASPSGWISRGELGDRGRVSHGLDRLPRVRGIERSQPRGPSPSSYTSDTTTSRRLGVSATGRTASRTQRRTS